MGKKVKTYSDDQIIGSFSENELAVHAALRNDPVLFCEHVCGWKPHQKQAEFLRLPIENAMKVMLPWGRGTGKSQAAIARTAWKLFASKGYKAYLFAPSGDQAHEIWDGICDVYKQSAYLNQYTTYKIKGSFLYVGGPQWASKCELVRVGLDGSLGRSRHTSGNGIILFDEASHFLYLNEVYGTLSPLTAAGGGTVLLSSPGSVGSPMHQMYLSWKELEKSKKRYRVLECSWQHTDHITEEWVDDQKEHHKAMQTEWVFEREVLGKWVSPANTWFPEDDIQRCIEPNIHSRQGDRFVWSCDPGGHGRDSAFVLCIARYNQALSRLEIVDLRSFKFANHKYRNDASNDGSETIDDYETIIDLCCDLRVKYPPIWFGYDMATERSLGEQLQNLQFPISSIMTGGYSAKLTSLQDLKRCLSEQRIVWNDTRITRQLQRYCPRRDEHTERWKFPSANADIVMCLGQLYRYLGERTNSFFFCGTIQRPAEVVF